MNRGSFKVRARARSNPTVAVQAGHQYSYCARGEWTDWTIQSDADGYLRWWLVPFTVLLRVRYARFYQLIGMIGGHILLLGREGTFTAPTSGRLVCFANDVWFMYWNNTGWVSLEITEVSSGQYPEEKS